MTFPTLVDRAVFAFVPTLCVCLLTAMGGSPRLKQHHAAFTTQSPGQRYAWSGRAAQIEMSRGSLSKPSMLGRRRKSNGFCGKAKSSAVQCSCLSGNAHGPEPRYRSLISNKRSVEAPAKPKAIK
jgi:hypothetical protein